MGIHLIINKETDMRKSISLLSPKMFGSTVVWDMLVGGVFSGGMELQ